MIDVQKIIDVAQEAAQISSVEIDGLTYSRSDMQRIDPPTALPIESHTLTSVIDYINNNCDDLNLDKLTVHVFNSAVVEIHGSLRESDRKRESYLLAKPSGPRSEVAKFLNEWKTQDAFVVECMSLFRKTDSREKLLAFVGNIAASNINTQIDDGVTQEVTIRTSVTKKENEAITNPVDLVPHRTFPEIELDPVPYLLRFRNTRSGGDEQIAPLVTLFECDGGWWKVDAVRKIAEFLREQLGDKVSVIA